MKKVIMALLFYHKNYNHLAYSMLCEVHVGCAT